MWMTVGTTLMKTRGLTALFVEILMSLFKKRGKLILLGTDVTQGAIMWMTVETIQMKMKRLAALFATIQRSPVKKTGEH